MRDTDYKGINTMIRTYELRLLKNEDFERLIKADSLKAALDFLKSTDYDFDMEEVLHKKNFNDFLMAHLARVYSELYEIVPQSELIDLFTLRYSYHNLKVLLKERFLEQEQSELLIPIGISIDLLRKLVETRESSIAHPIMVDAVRSVLEDYEESHRIEAVTVYMDTYYLRHLRAISAEVDNEAITKITDLIIDLYNLSTVVRSQKQDKPRSHLYALLSSAGSIAKQDIIDESINGSVAIIRKLYSGKSYSNQLEKVITNNDSVNTLKLDKMMDDLIHEVVSSGLYEPFGPMPLMGYLYAKETEITNLRLVLVGKDNDISEEILRERVRQVYGS